MEGAGSRVRPAMEGSEERDSIGGMGSGVRQALSRREGQRERSAREGGGAGQERSGRRWGTGDFCYIYQWQKRVILYKFDGEVSNPHAQKLEKLVPPSFLTVGKN